MIRKLLSLILVFGIGYSFPISPSYAEEDYDEELVEDYDDEDLDEDYDDEDDDEIEDNFQERKKKKKKKKKGKGLRFADEDIILELD